MNSLPEITDLDLLLSGNKNIGGFQVTMNQPCLVDKAISIYNLLYIGYCFLFWEGPLTIDLAS